VPTTASYPEMVRVQLEAGTECHSVVLYDDGACVRWAAYVHSSTHEAGRGEATDRTSAVAAAELTLAQHIASKVNCRTCNDTGCYWCDG